MALCSAGWRRFGRGGFGRSRSASGIRPHAVEERGGRDEKQAAGQGLAEIEQAIVVTGRPAYKHVFEHLLGGARRTTVADEIGAKFGVARAAERHVVAEDFLFLAVFDYGSERAVRRGRLLGIVELDVRQFLAANDALLGFGGELVPGSEVVTILLHDDITATREGRVFVTDEHGVDGFRASGIFCAIDKTEKVAVVEITKSLDFVDGSNSAADAGHDLCGQFEAQIHGLGANVEEQITWSGDGVAHARANFTKGMKFGRARLPEELIPGIGPEAHDAGEATFDVAKIHCAEKRREIWAERTNRIKRIGPRVYFQDQKDGGASEWRVNRLRFDGSGITRVQRGHGRRFHSMRLAYGSTPPAPAAVMRKGRVERSLREMFSEAQRINKMVGSPESA